MIKVICENAKNCHFTGCYHYKPHDEDIRLGCNKYECLAVNKVVECVPIHIKPKRKINIDKVIREIENNKLDSDVCEYWNGWNDARDRCIDIIKNNIKQI